MATLSSLSGFAGFQPYTVAGFQPYTVADIKNQIHTIENISEEVFKYEMEISHLHENSEYYIIKYNKIYTKQGYNYILKNADGNYYWATPGTKNFIELNKYPPEFEIKTYSFYKLIDKQGNTYLDEHKKPILELEAEFKKVVIPKLYKPNEKIVDKNKVVDDYYVSSYIYGLKYSLDTKPETTDNKNPKNKIPLTDIRNKIYDIKEQLKIGSKNIKDIKNKLDEYKDLSTKLTEIKEILENKEVNEVNEEPTPEEINEINKICEYVNNIKFDVFLIYVGKSDEENENRIKELLKTNKEKLKKFIDKYKQNKNIECVYKAGFSLAKIETLIEYVEK